MPACHPGRSPHRAVDDENAIFLHLHLWKTEPAIRARLGANASSHDGRTSRPASASTNAPVHVEATRRDRRKPRRRKFDHAWRQGASHGAAADHQGVEIPVVERLGRNADADRAADGPAGLGQQVHVIGRLADLPVCELEDRERTHAQHLKSPAKRLKPMRCMGPPTMS